MSWNKNQEREASETETLYTMFRASTFQWIIHLFFTHFRISTAAANEEDEICCMDLLSYADSHCCVMINTTSQNYLQFENISKAKFVCFFSPNIFKCTYTQLARGIMIWISSEFTMLLNQFLFNTFIVVSFFSLSFNFK